MYTHIYIFNFLVTILYICFHSYKKKKKIKNFVNMDLGKKSVYIYIYYTFVACMIDVYNIGCTIKHRLQN